MKKSKGELTDVPYISDGTYICYIRVYLISNGIKDSTSLIQFVNWN